MKIQLVAAFVVAIVSTVNAQTFTNYTTADGLLSDNVNAVDTDGGTGLWFGTQAGVSFFDGATWTDYTMALDSGLVDNNITAIKVMTNGIVWAGTDFGVSKYDGTWTTYTTTDGLGNNQIKCIEEDNNGDVWFGTNNGASHFDGTTWTNFGTADGLPFGGVTALMIQVNDDVWMGSGLGGIMIYDGSAFTALTTTANGLVDDRIRAMVTDFQGQRWVGTSEGITVLNNSNVYATNYTTMFSLPAPDTLNPIEDIEVDLSGNIWVGVYVDYLVTEGGICAFDGNSWVQYEVADGLVGPVVRDLVVDWENSVWVATSTGVSKISNHGVGLNKINATSDYTVYPNPTSDNISIRFQEGSAEDGVHIFNSSMQLVEMYEFPIGQEKIEISLGHLSGGIYFVRSNGVTKKLLLN